MSETIWALIVGAIVGILAIVIILDSDINIGSGALIVMCELELPRNQSCVLIAAPEKGEVVE